MLDHFSELKILDGEIDEKRRRLAENLDGTIRRIDKNKQ